ncbi:hypothetical protein BH11BAC3_BH11BAC3_12290 [soil metagenome]
MYKFIIQLRSDILVFLTHNMALPILRLVRAPQIFPYSPADLHLLAEGTLGKELITMLEAKNLQLLPYYAKHDIKHILLQYDTTDEGEVCLQCFMLGNGHLSFPVLATVIYGIVTMPEYWMSFRKAYHRGRQAPAISEWPWFALLFESTVNLIQKINQHENS